MQAFVFGMLGAGLGALIAWLRLPVWLSRLVLASATLAGLVLVISVNSILTEAYLPELAGNPLLGGNLFLLGLWYSHRKVAQERRPTPLESGE